MQSHLLSERSYLVFGVIQVWKNIDLAHGTIRFMALAHFHFTNDDAVHAVTRVLSGYVSR